MNRSKIFLTVLGQTRSIQEWADLQAEKLGGDPKRIAAAIRQRHQLNNTGKYSYTDPQIVFGVRKFPGRVPASIGAEEIARAVMHRVRKQLITIIGEEIDKFLNGAKEADLGITADTVYGLTFSEFRDQWMGTPGFETEEEIMQQWDLLPKD